jgi:hypothetical protein
MIASFTQPNYKKVMRGICFSADREATHHLSTSITIDHRPTPDVQSPTGGPRGAGGAVGATSRRGLGGEGGRRRLTADGKTCVMGTVRVRGASMLPQGSGRRAGGVSVLN